ncbi:MAG TPA: hypothetical protein VN114_10190 [Oxalicibacterium sp.]|uniref:hypothetical protein n=1 Tax=Oxalicibacterium sp. TaxID=2766525 RepID=UPI002C3B25E0|nr:hypothetical protein [Oxalicibacterium sp.]HWU98872.1 hypothetical protein [Oxalicibacterium sp.]
MVEVFQNEQTLLNDGMAFLPFNMSDETNATGVMFISRIVQTLRVHSLLHCFSMSLKDSAPQQQIQPEQNGVRVNLIEDQITQVFIGDRVDAI